MSESKTPRTDAEALTALNPDCRYDCIEAVPSDFARQLETELNEAQAELARWKEVAASLATAVRCPNCPDVGWFYDGKGQPVQCEWCDTTPRSRFKALAAYSKLKGETKCIGNQNRASQYERNR